MAFLVGDEEPMADLTDLSLLQVIGLLAALLCVFFDTIVKSIYGQSVSSDRVVAAYSWVKANVMLFYFGIIWLGFFAHVLLPLNVNNVDALVYGPWVSSCASGAALGAACALVVGLVVFLAPTSALPTRAIGAGFAV